MTHRKATQSVAGIVSVFILIVVMGLGFREARAHPRFAEEDGHKVWIAVLKGLNGPVRYLGSDTTYAYFRIGSILPKCYKVRTAATNLPPGIAFPLFERTPVGVTEQAWVAWRAPQDVVRNGEP